MQQLLALALAVTSHARKPERNEIEERLAMYGIGTYSLAWYKRENAR